MSEDGQELNVRNYKLFYFFILITYKFKWLWNNTSFSLWFEGFLSGSSLLLVPLFSNCISLFDLSPLCLLPFACRVTCYVATLHQCHCCCCCYWHADYRKSELWQPKKRGRRTCQWMSAKGRSVQTTVRLTPAPTQVMVGLASGV